METKINNFGISLENLVERQVFESLSNLSVNSAITSNIENYPIAIGTHPGNVRNRNEDRVAVAHIPSRNGNSYTLAIVCDGVGGSAYGDIAASLVVTFFISELFELDEQKNLEYVIDSILRRIDEKVRVLLKGEGTTTVSAVLATREEFLGVNIGDSRVFSWDTKGNTAHQISEDDTLENEFKKNNIKDVAALKIHNINNTLSQAIGERDRMSELLEVNFLLPSNFDKGIVLATDGAWKDTGEIFLSLLKQAPTSLDAVRRVLATATWCGGRDNITMLAIEDAKILQKISNELKNEHDNFNWITVWIKNSKLKISCPEPIKPDNKLKSREKASTLKFKTKNSRSIKNKNENKKSNRMADFKVIIDQDSDKNSENND
ncbi:PP2C family serine/threonine-protein phosphatase [Providencia rettgeri]|uniref:PP2C family protein-serine/threonine phosphatase n=1 Tax=Providencia rettgeri TaxID=587 RepID=UPI0013741A08|nr:PP2C family serine/threonine-protein phosphatase [Providencia rettgeri]MCG9526563.1 serine/threonine-protein phosphatase [Providencia rettgeri]BBV03409.1 hypothetical protein BML2531_11850 [Providencia rettgeri]